jgi:subfamily B ATP-binding cassette protein MsbA
VGTIKNFIGSAFSQIMYFAILIKISWKVTAAILIIYPILNYSSIWIIKKIKATSRVQAIHQIKFSQYIHNVLSCITLVKTMSTEDGEKRRFSELNNISERFSVSIIKKKLLLGPIHEMISVTMVISIVVAVVYIVKKDPTANITGFLVYFYVLRRFLSGSNFINSFNTTIAAASGSMVNLMNILNNENKFFITGGKREFAGLKTEIRLYHLNFSYIDAVPVLKDINFTIEKGKMTALVGPTGAGKTTITNLVLRLYEVQDNSIFIDGVDIKEFSIKTLMKRMAVVSQDAMLFNSSIRDNILYGLSDSIPDEIFEEALKKAHLFDLVSQLPEGVNTFIGDKGIKLSGGERQRLAIARALLRKPDILILDEATSSLDSITEKLVQEAVEEAVSDNTSLVIAHRLSTIKHADKILVVEGGRIVEQGSLNELIEKKGRFYSYWQAQKFE